MTNRSSTQLARDVLNRLGIARTRDLEGAGVTRTQVKRLCDRGVIERVARGLYMLPGAPRTELQHLAEACRRVPKGVICLLSALRFHGLTTQNPFEVWMAIDRKAWRPKVEHPPMRLVYLTGTPLEEGIEIHDTNGVPLRVFGPAKTIADCFKFRNKIGIDLAVEALRDYHAKYPKKLEAVWRHARVNRVTRVIQPYLDGLS